MSFSDFSLVSVAKFTPSYIVDFISANSNWSNREEVASKKQLRYICDYLSEDHIGAQTIAVESQYIDKHFLEDYSEYYARCFQEHPRFCARLHFFSNEFSEADYYKYLSNHNENFEQLLQDSYLGFIVLRPLPNTVLAKVCLKPYANLLSDDYICVRRPHEASFLGTSLVVNTSAFMEQDQVVSACATSSLWVKLSASKHISNFDLPSPSGITKTAISRDSERVRTFPNIGLTPLQIKACIKAFGLEPTHFDCTDKPDGMGYVKEFARCYLPIDVPVLLGGALYEPIDGGQYRLLGRHFVCITACQLGTPSGGDGNRLSFSARSIEKLYVHDDRTGPYARLDCEPKEFAFGGHTHLGYLLGLHSDPDRKDLLVPEVVIVGLDPKIRVQLATLHDYSETLFRHIRGVAKKYSEFVKAIKDSKELASQRTDFLKSNEDTLVVIQDVLRHSIDIHAANSSEFKKEIRNSTNFYSFNSVQQVSALLMTHLPKHVYRLQFRDGAGKCTTEVLFDATEVPQGQGMIGYVSYNEEADRFWSAISQAVKDGLWSVVQDTSESSAIRPFKSFFTKNQPDLGLNMLYGPMKTPAREPKVGELDEFQRYLRRSDVSKIRRGNTANWDLLLSKDKTYIWLINQGGDLVFGEDIEGDQEGFQGHPTLIDGRPARIAGELKHLQGIWRINLKSGAYSQHVVVGSEEYDAYVQNVIEENLVGLEVVAEAS